MCSINPWEQNIIKVSAEEDPTMINLYTSEKYFDPGKELIYLNDNLFDGTLYERKFTSEDIEAMLNIDKAEVIDLKLREIRTPYGLTDFSRISTGCKTLINIMHTKTEDNFVISLNGCSYEILDIIFDYIEDHESKQALYITTTEISKCIDRDFMLNNQKQLSTSMEVAGYIMSGEG